MKIMIEVSGGTVTGISATADCEIYLIDHDNMEEMGWQPGIDKLEAMHPDCVTHEGDHVAYPGASATPEFDTYLNEALTEYAVSPEDNIPVLDRDQPHDREEAGTMGSYNA